MAANLPVSLTDPKSENALAELVRLVTLQKMEISGEAQGKETAISICHCPIGQVYGTGGGCRHHCRHTEPTVQLNYRSVATIKVAAFDIGIILLGHDRIFSIKRINPCGLFISGDHL